MNRKVVTLTFILCLCSIICSADNNPIKKRKGREHYVKEQMSNMSLREMIGQLIMIGCDSDMSPAYTSKILKDIDSNKVGGICFFKGKSENIPPLIKKYNAVCKLPLLISIDGEWGLAMRLTDVTPFPRAMTLGALEEEDYNLVYEMGSLIAKQCKALGIHINFAPDADINLNSANPVINTRSFGQDRYRVAYLAEQYIRGMQDEGVMAVIKHFPGHGDTETDSHKSLPTISHDRNFIDTVDMYPFRYNIKQGVWGVMVGHLDVPAMNKDYNYPACINPDIIQDYLIEDLEFKGLVFTDAMNMKGLTNDYPDGQAQVLALKAGVDVLLMPNNTEQAMNAILQAVEAGTLSEKTIREKCKKVLRWKYDMGISNPTKDATAPIKALETQAKELNRHIADNVLTLLKNDEELLPLQISDSTKLSIVFLDDFNYRTFDTTINSFHAATTHSINSKTTAKQTDSILASLMNSDIIITLASGGVNQTKKENYGISQKKLDAIARIQDLNKKNILVLFANPYALASLDTLCEYNSLVMAYQNTADLQRSVAQAIFGYRSFKGSVPVTGSPNYPCQSGIDKEESQGYEEVVEAGMKVECFEKIDSIINAGISQKAYPGAQVLIAKDGNIVFNRNAGFQTYDNQTKITDNSIYDLASLTKVMATTLAVMKLYEEGKFSLDDKLSSYLPYLKHSKKSKITIKEALAHTARLKAFLPFWKESLEKAKQDETLYAHDKYGDSAYLQVCDGLFIKKSYKDEIRKQIVFSPLGDKHKYVYSDLGFILLGDLVEQISGETLDTYLQETFYEPLGLTNTYFNPLSHGMNKENIVPTLEAIDFRHSKLQGFVHDETSALNGGVAGHAGLFSNAKDLFVICQMLLNGGVYDNKRYLEEETIATFNHRYFKKYQNRRALGFDKPLISAPSAHCSEYCSEESYGHSGFTGTYLWIDPENKTIFIFLSNRVYPDAKSNKLAQMNIRTDIQDLIYESIQEENKE